MNEIGIENSIFVGSAVGMCILSLWGFLVPLAYADEDLNKKQIVVVILLSGPVGWICWPPIWMLVVILDKLMLWGRWIVRELR